MTNEFLKVKIFCVVSQIIVRLSCMHNNYKIISKILFKIVLDEAEYFTLQDYI